MKYFVFSDIHGYYSLLKQKLNEYGFDENNDEHMLISIGDNFDRGLENYEMFLFLKEMKNKNKIILIKGNHEDLMMEMLSRGYPISRDYSNGTYDALNQFYKRYYNIDADVKPNDFHDVYIKLKEDGFIDLIYQMLDYYETKNYVFTHGFIPVNGIYNYYYNSNCSYDPDWRKSDGKRFELSRWINGIEMSIKYDIGEPNKKIIIGHFHSSYGNIRKDLKEPLSDSILKRLEFSDFRLFEPYIDKNIIAIDACTTLTKKVNVLVIED